jgi:hypothetical protein
VAKRVSHYRLVHGLGELYPKHPDLNRLARTIKETEMYCKCGNNKEMKHNKHEVLTIEKATEYYQYVLIDNMPLTIEKWSCRCGIVAGKVIDSSGALLRKFGQL